MRDSSDNFENQYPAKLVDQSDADLLTRCRDGDQNAWNDLVDRFQRLICTIPRKAGLTEDQVSDVFQDVFLTLYQKLDQINQPDKLRSWLVTTAKFKTWGIIRGKKNFEHIDDDTNEHKFELKDSSPVADDLLVKLEEQHLIRTALELLEKRCRTILTMLYMDEQTASYSEVAEKIHVATTSISPLRARCLKRLAKILTE